MNKTTEYAIYHLDDSGIQAKDIAKELDINLKDVKSVLKKKQDLEKPKNSIQTTSAKVTSKDLMIRETSVKGNKSVAIMTKAASEANDQFRKTMNNSTSRTTRNAIHKMNNKKK